MRENMNDNFKLLEARVIDTLEKSDLERIREELIKIKGPVICTGVGGSSVVSEYASKVLNQKNGIVTDSLEMRDLNYKNLDGYSSVLACSYSGNNYGVETAFRNNLEKYLLSTGEIPGVHNLTYSSGFHKEDSFISLGATLMPMSILLSYYLDGNIELIKEILNSDSDFDIDLEQVYEIMSGYESSSAAKYMESTMTESGISIPVVHDKYSYCHGRSTMSHHNNHSLIMFNSGNELDQLLLDILGEYYKKIICVDGKYNDSVIDDFYYTYMMMLLSKKIAEASDKDLSRVKYSPATKVLYKYKGNM